MRSSSMNTDHTLEEVRPAVLAPANAFRQIEAKALRKLKHPSVRASCARSWTADLQNLPRSNEAGPGSSARLFFVRRAWRKPYPRVFLELLYTLRVAGREGRSLPSPGNMASRGRHMSARMALGILRYRASLSAFGEGGCFAGGVSDDLRSASQLDRAGYQERARVAEAARCGKEAARGNGRFLQGLLSDDGRTRHGLRSAKPRTTQSLRASLSRSA